MARIEPRLYWWEASGGHPHILRAKVFVMDKHPDEV